jgi:hypothetical protein
MEIAAWRERLAQERDVPRSRVMKDEALFEVAAQAPLSIDDLDNLRGVPRGFAGSRGAVGLVTDGGLRDGLEIAAMPFPAYARGVVASTRLSTHHAADVNVPVACAGVAVYPGDIVVGDGDGITIIPRAMAQEIADACEKRDQFEAYVALRIEAGEGLYGVYPPTPQTRADYEAWKHAGSDPAKAHTIRAEAV